MAWHQIITLLVLGIIAWEDMRERSIHWYWLPLLTLGLVVPAVSENSVHELVMPIGFNLAFIGFQFAAILLFLMLRNRRWVDPFQYIGLGDLLFFAVLALALSPANFLVFYLSGLALCLPAYFLLVRLKPTTPRSVPTAGFLALYLMIWSMADMIGPASGLFTGCLAEDLLAHVQ